MRPAIVVFGAIGAIEVALVRHVKAALQRFAIEKTLTRFQNVIAGEFATDFIEKLHAIMKERTAYDNLSTKQLCPRYLRVTLATFSWIPQPASPKSNVDDIDWVRINFRLAHPINHAFGSARDRLVSFRQKFCQDRKVLHWI
jgi:hypothetical protein